jgi:HAD superfamily hydrolase (TIGR01509 family)
MKLLQPPEPFAALIFDCDGTLADTLPLHCRAWTAAFASAGLEMKEEWYFARAGVTRSQLLQEFRQECGRAFDESRMSNAQRRHFIEDLKNAKGNDVVTQVAKAMYGKVAMAVASGSDRLLVEMTLTAIGMRRFFDTIVTIEDVERSKPAPDLFLRAAHRMRVAPERCVVYEDSNEGLEAARRAGMRSIDVRCVTTTRRWQA